MKEQEILSVISSIIGNDYIGDDCAYLEDLGLVITQDSLVEGVHFSLDYMTPYQLGYKSIMVNISDISASGGEPKYVTIALSLPKNITTAFVEEFYNGAKSALGNVKIIGGDITGGEKIVVSITALGTTKNRKISSRKNAQTGQVVVVSGVHGSSAGGLELLKNKQSEPQNLINAHLLPVAQVGFSEQIATLIDCDYAMMDTSDGLADALVQIANFSNKTLIIDFDKIPFDKELKECFSKDYQEKILYGGEDYQIVATLPENFAKKITNATIIGKVIERKNDNPVEVFVGNNVYTLSNDKCFNHFE